MRTRNTLTSLGDVEKFLFDQIPSFERKFPGKLGLERTRYLMRLLGDPQERLKMIHIAGTSGKGSTAYFTSLLLRSLGFKVGLTLSPHLIDFRERFQINGGFLSEKKMVSYFNEFLPVFRQMETSKFGLPTYFEIVQAVAFLIFYKEKVDYAIVEVGMGGTFDATNVVERSDKVCLLTKIGLDHTKTLGGTTTEIARQKAGIIHKGNTVFTVNQRRRVASVFEIFCKRNEAKLIRVRRLFEYKNVRVEEGGIYFDFSFGGLTIKNLFVSTLGFYQVQNLSLALVAVVYLSKRDGFSLTVEKIRVGTAKVYFPGRFDVKNIKGVSLIIDGAHNPQKMRAFLDSLAKVFPDKKYNFVIAFKRGKDYKKMLSQIQPFAVRVYTTSFFVQSDMKENLSMDEGLIAESLKNMGFGNIVLEHNPAKCLKLALKETGELPLVITGSLYLAGEIYKALAEAQ